MLIDLLVLPAIQPICLYSLTINTFMSSSNKSEILSKLLRLVCNKDTD